MVTYAATIWWPTVRLKTSKAQLNKLQRIVCLGITGAMRTAPTAAMKSSLDSPTTPAGESGGPGKKLRVTLQQSVETQISRLWICIHDSGHGKEPILQMGSDKMLPRHIYNELFTIKFPDRSEWKRLFQPDRKGD
jgi:hypothetical protein